MMVVLTYHVIVQVTWSARYWPPQHRWDWMRTLLRAARAAGCRLTTSVCSSVERRAKKGAESLSVGRYFGVVWYNTYHSGHLLIIIGTISYHTYLRSSLKTTTQNSGAIGLITTTQRTLLSEPSLLTKLGLLARSRAGLRKHYSNTA